MYIKMDREDFLIIKYISTVTNRQTVDILLQEALFFVRLEVHPTVNEEFFTLKMEAICFSQSSVLTRATRSHIPEDSILQCASDSAKPM
jgi:hypothetical protein